MFRKNTLVLGFFVVAGILSGCMGGSYSFKLLPYPNVERYPLGITDKTQLKYVARIVQTSHGAKYRNGVRVPEKRLVSITIDDDKGKVYFNDRVAIWMLGIDLDGYWKSDNVLVVKIKELGTSRVWYLELIKDENSNQFSLKKRAGVFDS